MDFKSYKTVELQSEAESLTREIRSSKLILVKCYDKGMAKDVSDKQTRLVAINKEISRRDGNDKYND